MSQLFARKTVDQCVADSEIGGGLRRSLGPLQLTALGIGAIIGAGIFAAIGTAISGDAGHLGAGSAIVISIILAGVTSAFAAITYSEFAAMIPISGSAYTYAYATLGELFAWIIGWDLILEYAVGNIAVAIGWAGYFDSLLPIFHEGLSWIPAKIPAVFHAAPVNYCVNVDVAGGCPHTGFVATGSYFDLPAILITFILTIILVKGIKESASFNAFMVAIKLVIVLMVIGIGGYLIITVYGTASWHPFAPYGYTGVSFFGKSILGGRVRGGVLLCMFVVAAII